MDLNDIAGEGVFEYTRFWTGIGDGDLCKGEKASVSIRDGIFYKISDY
jgi:predicted transcriptional regulator